MIHGIYIFYIIYSSSCTQTATVWGLAQYIISSLNSELLQPTDSNICHMRVKRNDFDIKISIKQLSSSYLCFKNILKNVLCSEMFVK